MTNRLHFAANVADVLTLLPVNIRFISLLQTASLPPQKPPVMFARLLLYY